MDARLAPHPSPAEVDDVRRTLSSPALSQVFELVAAGTGGPTALTRALKKSKVAVSQNLAQLRNAGLVTELRNTYDDGRRKHFVPVWERFGEIFAIDHQVELELFHAHLVGPAPEGTPRAGIELALTGAGKLLVLEHRRTGPPEVSDERLAEAAGRLASVPWEFTRLFQRYLFARTFPSLRDHLLACFQETARYASRLPEDSALGAFMRFRAELLAQEAPIDRLLEDALGARAVPPGPIPVEAPVLVTRAREAGRPDAEGRFQLTEEARRLAVEGTGVRRYPSYVYADA